MRRKSPAAARVDWPYRSNSAVSGASIRPRNSQMNRATWAPSATRWSNTQVNDIVGRTTTSSPRTTGRGLIDPMPRMAASDG